MVCVHKAMTGQNHFTWSEYLRDLLVQNSCDLAEIAPSLKKALVQSCYLIALIFCRSKFSLIAFFFYSRYNNFAKGAANVAQFPSVKIFIQ